MPELAEQEQLRGASPDLTVILAVGGQRERAARSLRSVLDQSAIERMEVLLYDLGPEALPPLPGSDHPCVTMARLGPNGLLNAARVRGIHDAQSPVVCFIEEHCEMQPGWAEMIIDAHREPWAAVGTDFINANPGAGKSDQAFRMNYGVYVRPFAQRGPVSLVAGQNSSFKRDVLLQYEPDLELLLNAEIIIQWKMQKDGYRLFYEPRVAMAHHNENTFRSLALGAFYWNWCFSNVRAQVFNWGIFRRIAWIALLPLMPWVRLARLAGRMSSRGYAPLMQLIRDIPFVVGIHHCAAAGQLVGLLKPIDRGVREFSHFEMNEPRLSCTEVMG